MSLEIDWSSAEVHGGDVTVELAGKVSKQSRERFEAVRSLLGESSGGWDEVKLVKRTIHVRGLRPGEEHELRHFLDTVVVQVNAELPSRDEEAEQASGPSDRAAIADAEMTATLRSFAEQQARR
ncbi:MAG TPA: hypothetical protein VGH09_05655 [Solirubrobacteraceae bacterium]|jgi:hypothetical protein